MRLVVSSHFAFFLADMAKGVSMNCGRAYYICTIQFLHAGMRKFFLPKYIQLLQSRGTRHAIFPWCFNCWLCLVWSDAPCSSLYVGKWWLASWYVCSSIWLLPLPLFFSSSLCVHFSRYFLSYVFFCVELYYRLHCIGPQRSIYSESCVRLAGIYLPHHFFPPDIGY